MQLYISVYFAYIKCFSLGEILPPFALLFIVDEESWIEDKKSILEGCVHSTLFEQDTLLEGLIEIECKTSSFSSSHTWTMMISVGKRQLSIIAM